MNIIEIFGRKLTIVEDNTNTCKKCALSDICPLGLMPCKDARASELGKILVILNTLKVKEMELEKEIEKELETRWKGEYIYTKKFRESAKHFFELGLCNTITEEDYKLIWNIGDEIPYMPEEKFFKELLKRYKAKKGE